ncbi:efflux RND transporter permease subunit [Parapedobacter sp. GCM10030251]|uniref:efflux RND transporter permease subunit n=1 Tax=Parapedobacter sp. GCM10030251 TaxID=3273419 RepID=UPI003615117D
MKRNSTTPFSSFSILVISLMLGLVGLVLIPQLSIQLIPSRSYASVTVHCSMLEASPEVVDMELTNPIERTLARLHGVQRIRSTSGQGAANVHVALDKWTDPAKFRFEAATVLRQLYPQLPATASYPTVYLNRPTAGYEFGSDIIGYTLGGPGTADGIAQLAEQRIRSVLAEIKGIHRVNITGTHPSRVAIDLDLTRLRQHSSGIADFQRQLQEGLAVSGLGVVRIGNGKVDMAIERCIASIHDLHTFPIKGSDGHVFYLPDVATVDVRPMPSTSHYRINGEELVYINVAPEEHVNNIALAKRIRAEMQGVGDELMSRGYRLDMIYDNTEYIQEELGKIYLRTGLSMAILLLFVLLITRKWRYLLIVILSLAVNVAVSLVFYYLFRLEIHLYSLAGITISLGLIIDNVIVIVEDIRHTGRNRIFAAILASTLTALGALSVIFLLEENARVNLLDFAVAIIINLLVSLPVAYFFIPALLERLPVMIKPNRLFFRRKRRLVRFSRLYARQLATMLRFRWTCLLIMLLCFGLPLFMLPEKMDGESRWAKAYNAVFGSEFYNRTLRDKLNKYAGGTLFLYANNQMDNRGGGGSSEERVQLNVQLTMPNGATLAQMDAVVTEFEEFLRRFTDEVERFTAHVSNANNAFISIRFNKRFEGAFPHRLKHLLEARAIQSGAADFSVYGVGRGFSNAIGLDNFDSTIELRGYHYGQLQTIGLQVRDSLLRNPRVQDIVISTQSRWQQRRYEEFMVGIDRPEYLASYGIGRHAMGTALQAIDERSTPIGIIKATPGVFTPIAVFTNTDMIAPLWSVMNAPLQVNDSAMIRLNDVSTIKKVRMGDAIVRENQEYLLNVHYRFVGPYQLNSIVQKRVVDDIRSTLPYGYSVELPSVAVWGLADGAYPHLWLIALVLLIIYIICAVLLESFRQPFAVVLMIPFSFIGVFLTFHFLALQFDQGGYASLLLLSGLVTNAALYIINDFNYLRWGKAVATSASRRVFIRAFNAKAMPILITTLSAILSLLPFMISGAEKGFWFTLSAGTIGGLLFSILGAYLLLPLCLLERTKGRQRESSEHQKI